MSNVITPELTTAAPIAAENDQQPMSYYVSNGMRAYFTNLGEAKPTEVYEYWLQQTEAPMLKVTMDYCGSNQTRSAKIFRPKPWDIA